MTTLLFSLIVYCFIGMCFGFLIVTYDYDIADTETMVLAASLFWPITAIIMMVLWVAESYSSLLRNLVYGHKAGSRK